MQTLETLPEWQTLLAHQQTIQKIHLRDLFKADAERGNKFFINAADLMLDYSKNRMTQETIHLLIQLAHKLQLEKHIESLFKGDLVNITENRPALHTALRQQDNKPIYVNNKDIVPEIKDVLAKMTKFVNAVHTNQWQGFTNKAITDVVNIGMGGSDLGPVLAIDALQPYAVKNLQFHFISNIDSAPLYKLLEQLNPETTLFIVSSKSFSTQETLSNAKATITWFKQHAHNPEHLAKHFIAITSKPEKAQTLGITAENIFPIWDWVGGRYSLWSAIGLPIALAIGMENFSSLLQGANAMDEHFRTAELSANMPVILGLLSVWYNNFFAASAHAILPYDSSLQYLPAYLQQAVMESNGKCTDIDGNSITYNTSPLIFGGIGTNGQHAFYQLLHQGTAFIPADFIVPLQTHYPLADHHDILVANAFSQSQTLMLGKTKEEVVFAMKQQGCSNAEIEKLAPHRHLSGNKPSNTILLPKLTPKTFGALIALYEHKIFTESVIWQINAFDQWGVEWGKYTAEAILKDLKDPAAKLNYDSSTNHLITKYLKKN